VSEPVTVEQEARRALAVYEELTSLGEDIEDEWSYVNDLATAWRGRIDEVIEARGEEPLGAVEQAALERAIDEVGQISDPHRAIDWLSTFPQVVLTILGERP
jgi:hypothetical protein